MFGISGEPAQVFFYLLVSKKGRCKMGCDIHLHTEVKIEGRWFHQNCPNINRDYELFGVMAGVRRSEILPIVEPQGVPADASKLTQFEYNLWGEDAHTASWFGVPEIVKLEKWWKQNRDGGRYANFFEVHFGYFFGNSYSDFTKHPQDNPAGLEDVRFVFWFDN